LLRKGVGALLVIGAGMIRRRALRQFAGVRADRLVRTPDQLNGHRGEPIAALRVN
jgi:hypothetical protein